MNSRGFCWPRMASKIPWISTPSTASSARCCRGPIPSCPRNGCAGSGTRRAASSRRKSEKQAKRILSLLIGHANVLAVTLIHGPQHYEPRFYSHNFPGNSVPVIDEWCCGYVKGIALDPEGWQPLIDAQPDWFEVIHLYGTKGG